MNKNLFLSVVGCCLVTLNASFAQTAPASGSYLTDPTNTYVQDQALDSISTVNMIMCFIGSLRPEQKVGSGPYNALVDQSKCNNKGATGETTAAGATSAVDYVSVVVDSSRVSTAEAMKVKAWVAMKNDTPMSIYTYTTVSAGASSTQPNGVFTMDFSGYPVAMPTTLAMRGSLSASGTDISFHETGPSYNGGSGTYTTALTLTQSGANTGSGRVSDSSRGAAEEITFAYNSTHFKRKKGSDSAQCFSRDDADGDYSTWRYGVYKADGSRLDLTNPAFNVTYTSGGNVYYGQAGFYGVFFPDAALSAMGSSADLSRPGSTTPYTYSSVGGKLTKLSKGETTLSEVKGQSMRVWGIPGSSGETKINWDGTNVVKTETMTCDSTGCTGTVASGNVTANALRTAGFKSLSGYSDSVGGQVMVEVPSSGEFSASTKVFYRTRSTVTPAQANALTLICVSDCLKGKDAMGSALTGGTTPYETVGSATQNWGPTLASSAKTYVFTSTGMMVLGTDNTVTTSQVDASGFSTTTQLKGQYQYGLRSSMLAPATSTAIKCDSNGTPNTSGTYICPHLFQTLTESYEWETGVRPWNKYAGLTTGGAAVTFDPPKRLSLTLASTNSTLPSANSKIGSKIMLDYNGFGNLSGIPGACYNPATNIKGPCGGTNTAYAPDFSLKAGAMVTDGVDNYFVKPIDQEVRFGKVDDSFCSSLTLPTTAVLPTASSSADPKITLGQVPTPLTAAPSVIHGIVQ